MQTVPESGRASAPKWLFVLELSYLPLLVAIAIAYQHWDGLRSLVPDPAGPVPLVVPWWGALGGVTISLTGIFRNAKKWDPSYNAWHVARPFLGATIGSVGYLIFAVAVHASGSGLTTTSSESHAAFALVGFLVGYREELFRQLLKRATDVMFSTGTTAPSDGK